MNTRVLYRTVLLAILSLYLTPVASAHHSWARYDAEKIVTISGVVTRLEWTSPHVFFFFEATDEAGQKVEWTVEMDPPVLLRRYGLLPNMIPPGTRVICNGVQAKSGASMMRVVNIELEDGTVIRVSSRV